MHWTPAASAAGSRPGMARTCPDRVCPTQNPLEPFCHWSVEGPGASDEFVFLDLTFVLVTVSIRSHWWADRLQMPLRGTALKQDGRPKMVNVEKNMETSSLDLPFFKRSCPLEVRNAFDVRCTKQSIEPPQRGPLSQPKTLLCQLCCVGVFNSFICLNSSSNVFLLQSELKLKKGRAHKMLNLWDKASRSAY